MAYKSKYTGIEIDSLLSKIEKANLELVVDSQLSNTSENPVQNKVVSLALQSEIDRATLVEEKLSLSQEKLSLSVQLVEQSLELVEDSISNITIKLVNIEDRISLLEDGGVGSDVMTKVEDNTNAIELLNSDEETYGSVANMIKTAQEWVLL